MIVRATSDLHLKQSNAEFVFEALAQLEDDARRHGGVTFILGDVFDQPETMHVPTFNRLRDVLHHWPGDGVRVLAGNHDQYARPRAAVEALAGGACRVYTTPTAGSLGRIIPYVDDFVAGYEKAVPFYGSKSLPIVWAHVGFRGAYMNAMKRDRTGVPASFVDTSSLVVTGHYHLPHAVGRVIYTGSPIEHSFSEEGQQKGWLRWDDIETNIFPQRIAFVTSAPRHITINWDPTGKGSLDSIAYQRDRDKIRVKTAAPRSVAKNKLKQLQDRGLQGVPVLAQPDEEATRGIVSAGATPQEAVEEYVRAVYSTDLNRPSPGEMLEWAQEYDLLLVG